MASTNPIKLKISGPGIQFEHDLNPQQTSAIISFVLGSADAPIATSSHSGGVALPGAGAPTQPPANAPALREFLNSHNPNRIPEIIVAIAVYFKLYRSKPLITRSELLKAFEEASEAAPGNLPRDLKWTVKTGWLAPKAGAKDTYYATASGESAVTAKFPADLKKKTKVNLGPRKARKAAGKS